MDWFTASATKERTRLAELAQLGMPSDLLIALTRQLERFEADQRTALAEQFTVEEAVGITGLHANTVRRKAAKGEVGTQKQPRGRITLTRADVENLGRAKPRPQTHTLSLVDHFKR